MQQRETDRIVTITDLAIREGISYQVARERALRGLFGPVKRFAGRLYVSETGKATTSSR